MSLTNFLSVALDALTYLCEIVDRNPLPNFEENTTSFQDQPINHQNRPHCLVFH